MKNSLIASFVFVTLSSACVVEGELADDQPVDDDELELDETWQELAAYTRSVQNIYTGKCLDIPWGSLASGAAVNQFTCHGGPAQQFAVEGTPGIPGFVRIRNLRSGLCATPTGYQGYSTPSMPLVQVACGSTSNWTRENTTTLSGGYRTTFRWAYDSAYCIDVPGGWSTDSLQLQAYPCHGGPNQRFDVRP